MSRAYEYRHVVCLEETNLVGNVYYVNHLRWQGRCRELFLEEHAPGVIAALRKDLALVTTHCSCEYFQELEPFDRIVVRMRLTELQQNRVTMRFDYHRARADAEPSDLEALVARGEQQIACMRRTAAGLVAIPVPEELRTALQPYR